MSERVSFGREAAVPERSVRSLLVGLVVLLVGIGVARPLWRPTVPRGVVVELVGDVPRPGAYLVDPPTLRTLLAQAGVDLDVPDRSVAAGDRVSVAGGEVSIAISPDPVAVGLPLDPNVASADAFHAVPGVSRRAGEALVREREEGGPYRSVEDLARAVPGDVVEALRPFVVVGDVPAPSLSTATAGELERLPGIGEALAARIVADRVANGPYGSVDDLGRVAGIGPELVERLRPLVVP